MWAMVTFIVCQDPRCALAFWKVEQAWCTISHLPRFNTKELCHTIYTAYQWEKDSHEYEINVSSSNHIFCWTLSFELVQSHTLHLWKKDMDMENCSFETCLVRTISFAEPCHLNSSDCICCTSSGRKRDREMERLFKTRAHRSLWMHLVWTNSFCGSVHLYL